MAVKYQANERLRASKSEDVKRRKKVRGVGRSQFQLYVSKWRHLSVETFGTRRSLGLELSYYDVKLTAFCACPNNTLNNVLSELQEVLKYIAPQLSAVYLSGLNEHSLEPVNRQEMCAFPIS